MKHCKIFELVVSTIVLLVIGGCGSGGGSGTTNTGPTQAVIYLSTEGTPSSQPLYGVEVTLSIPSGVTVATDSTGTTSDGVVTATGAAAGATAVTGHYSSASRAIQIEVANATNGFGTGQFATVICGINKGYSPKASDFSTSNFVVSDKNGVPITGLSIAYTVDVR